MKPIQIFLIFFIVLLLLLTLAFIFPPRGIEGPGGIILRFPGYRELLSKPQEPDYSDISHILEQSEVLEKEAEKPALREDSLIATPPKDSITVDAAPTVTYPVYHPDSLKKLVYPMSFPEDDPSILHSFFRKLEYLQSMDKPLRILHYGDSQIEGDRITSYIREKMQEKFGGYGPGLFSPDMVVQHTLSLKQQVSSNWMRYGVKDMNNEIIDHRRLGIMLNFGRYTFPDTTAGEDSVLHEAEIEIEPSGLGYSRVEYIDRIRFFYGYNRFPVHIEINVPGKTAWIDTLPVNRSFRVLSTEISGRYDHLLIRFRGVDSPDLYAISLESNKGIMADNIPMRGSSGLDFSRCDTLLFKEMLNELNPGLILLQFGVNIAPHIVKGYKWYENRFYKELVTLKSLSPGVSIVVLGISDLSRKVDGSYESYPNIIAIRDAQKNAAFRAGCGFWDTFEAMGGENSMPGWVFADPPLARSDFVHFSNLGSKVIGEMFHNALMEEYEKFCEADDDK